MKSRLVFPVLLSTLAMAALLGALHLYTTQRLVREQIERAHPLLVDRARDRVLGGLASGQAEIERIAAAASGGAPKLGRILGDALAGASALAGVVALDPEGAILGSAGSGPALDALLGALIPKSAVDFPLEEVMRGTQLRKRLASVRETSLLSFDTGAGPQVPLASTPLRSPRGRLMGSLHGLFRLDELAAVLADDPVASGHVLYVANAEGRTIFGTDAASAEPEAPRFGWASGDSLALTVAAPVGVFDWTVVVEQTMAAALAPLLVTLSLFAGVALVTIVVSTLIASGNARSALRPLGPLLEGVRKLGKGDFDVEFPRSRRHDELGRIVEAFNKMAQRLRRMQSEFEANRAALQEQNQAFQNQHEVLSRLSVTDGLTKLNNHRFFQDQLGREIKRISRTGKGLSMLMIDIDDFKKLNDTFGHSAGDEFLVQTATLLRESIRETDLVARYGGEEFVVLATGTPLEGAVILAEKIRMAIAEASFIVDDSMRPRKSTVSIGVAEFKGSRSDFFRSADAALYRAKHSGKDCVVAADPSEPEA
jgi:diguanylate cyclase (GGDEF)-like protein